MQAVFKLSRRSIDQLEKDLISRAQRINTEEYEFLVDLREFDLRQGWEAYHFNNCAEWLNFKCGIDLSTGREKVRVARCLFDLPRISAAFAAGELSYTKARSLTRVATARNEEELLAHALKATTSQVQARCLRLRNANRAVSTTDSNHIHRNRSLRCSRHPDGSMTITVEVAQETGELVMKTIERALSDLKGNANLAVTAEVSGTVTEIGESDASRDASESAKAVTSGKEEDSLFAQQADALVHIARNYLAGGEGKRSCCADNYQVFVHVDETALRKQSCQGAKSDLPIETVRRLCCDGAIVPVTENEQGEQLNVGRKHRVVQPALRRALLTRDKCCQYPGCSHTKWLDAHHVKHWADGGETKLKNTLLLCSKHHRSLHEGGYTIKHSYLGERYFETSSGRVVT